MKSVKTVLTLGVSLLICQSAGASLIVFDNFGPGDTYATGGNWFGTGGTQYMIIAGDFIPTGTGPLDELWTAMTYAKGENELTLSVCADAAGKPGSVLWQDTFYDALPTSSGGVLHVADLGGPVITAGTKYWLMVEAPEDGSTSHNWWANDQGDIGDFGFRINHAPWDIFEDVSRHTLRVGVVPEPASVLLCLAAAGAMITGRIRRK